MATRAGLTRSGAMLTLAALFGCTDATGPHPERAAPVLYAHHVEAAGIETNAVLRWNRTALETVSRGTLGPPMVARALAIVHTAMFDAWAAYDDVAIGTRLGGALRRPTGERTEVNRIEAVSYAAYRALVDLFPVQRAHFDARMSELGLDPGNDTDDPTTPAGIGNAAAAALLSYRHGDGSNQDGSLGPSGMPYSDYTGYAPVNSPDEVSDPNRWQPLRYRSRDGTTVVTQTAIGAHWHRVVPFALASADQFRPPPPASFPHGRYRRQAEELIRLSATLGDREKVVAEYWADGPMTVLPPGHFNLFAQFVSLRDGHTLDQDVVLFFVLTNAVFDAGVAVWDAKNHYDYVRPITAIRYLKRGRRIRAWAGPGLGTRVIAGEAWRPYQPDWFPTPPFAEYVSGHSTFSAAGAEILERFTGSDRFDASVTITQGDLGIEPGVPATPVTLAWPTFSAAADEAGFSRRYGGIHFEDADLEGRRMGRAVAGVVWQKALGYVEGTASVLLDGDEPGLAGRVDADLDVSVHGRAVGLGDLAEQGAERRFVECPVETAILADTEADRAGGDHRFQDLGMDAHFVHIPIDVDRGTPREATIV